MTGWVVVAGLLAGLGAWLAVSELVPAAPGLSAALERLGSAAESPAGTVQSRRERLGHALRASAPWLPVPEADLALLGQDIGGWVTSKVGCGLLGLAVAPVLSALVILGGHRLPWSVPAGATLGLAAAMFFLPDLVTRVNARQRREHFRHALTSYLDLVSLERGAGAAPTQALEAAAHVGGGWAFERIGAALDQARKASKPPWDGLASLAAQIGVPELADLADIAGVAGQEGARILDTLAARAESMRAQALAAAKARAGARSTTMVLPIAMLASGFLVLLVFPDFYRLFG